MVIECEVSTERGLNPPTPGQMSIGAPEFPRRVGRISAAEEGEEARSLPIGERCFCARYQWHAIVEGGYSTVQRLGALFKF